jgi:UDP-glucose/GDP-mannose dehydrogenase family, NAD binding domain
MNMIKTASVCGLGKLGACIGATLAARGFDVVGVDIDEEKVKKINEGLAPLDEPLLAETIGAGHSRLHATLDPRETVATDVTFFIPPSPSLPAMSTRLMRSTMSRPGPTGNLKIKPTPSVKRLPLHHMFLHMQDAPPILVVAIITRGCRRLFRISCVISLDFFASESRGASPPVTSAASVLARLRPS